MACTLPINIYSMILNNTNKKGFTLIELLVVIAILGSLAAIAFPAANVVEPITNAPAPTATPPPKKPRRETILLATSSNSLS